MSDKLWITREEIGLIPARSVQPFTTKPDRITGHWGGVDPMLRTEGYLFALMRQIQYQDMFNKGYSDIMYSFCANPFRPLPLVLRGAGVRGAANGTVTGNATSPTVLFPFGPNATGLMHIPNWRENLIASARIADDIIEFTHGRPLPWVGHRDWKPTQCPGDWIYSLIRAGFDDRPEPPPAPTPFVPAADLRQRPRVGFNNVTRDPEGQDGYVRWVQDFLNRTSPEGCSVDGIWGWISHDRLTKFQGYFRQQGFPCRVNGITDLDTWATIHYIATVHNLY